MNAVVSGAGNDVPRPTVSAQEQAGEAEEQEETHAVSDERQHDAGALRRVAARPVQHERDGDASDGGDDDPPDSGGGEDPSGEDPPDETAPDAGPSDAPAGSTTTVGSCSAGTPGTDAWVLALLADGGIAVPTEVSAVIAIAWLGVMGSFVAYLLFFFLIEHLGATMASMVTYLFPVVGVALGVTLLGEPMDVRLAAGTILVLVGIVVVSLRYDAAVSRVPSGVRE